ncbi:MAG TPA: sortase [Mycobacteriales bacterium]|nr:sortase [Mycobacteriales bacterium]
MPLAGSAVSVLALVLGALVLWTAVLSHVSHARSQRVAYADLRIDLAESTAPTGQLDQEGRPHPLGTPLGYLTIPELGLQREVFFEGTTSQVLASGPGHRRSTVLPGQAGTAILYGRAWSHGGPFGGLEDLATGTRIAVTTGQGEHTYAVTGRRRGGDRAPAPPDAAAGEGRLTLVTAIGAPYAPADVVYVDADLTSDAVDAAPRAIAPRDLLESEQALAGDPSAWAAVFLAMQGLAFGALGTTWAARRWGRAQAWLVGFPVLGVLAVLAARSVLHLLPNLL